MMSSGRTIVIAAAVAAFTLCAGPVVAAQQGIAGKKIKIQNLDPGGDTSRRRITYQALEKQSADTLVGDPTVGGATLAVQLDGQTQCFSMPASGWSSQSGVLFRYSDGSGANGPVKVALIKRTAGGAAFQIKVTVLGYQGPGPQPIITIIPPGTQLDTNFAIGSGDEYCSTFGGTIQVNDQRLFLAKNADHPASCNVAACP